MKNKVFGNLSNIHFIGIGGIGISALAGLLFSLGKNISGTEDNESPETLDTLRAKGVKISLGLDPLKLPLAACYIYSDAWLSNHPEIINEAKKRDVPVMSYFEALGEVTNEFFLIAIAGTHGKTTTTAMVGDVLENGGLDPTVVVGSLRSVSGSNFRKGESEYFVVEADEYLRHFLNLSPRILVITNIEEDHLDYYKNLKDIESAFLVLANKVPQSGFIVCDSKDETVARIVKGAQAKIIDYNKFLFKVPKLLMPGLHNRKNAAVALAIAKVMGIKPQDSIGALTKFSGTWRRFEYRGETKNGMVLYDDYAHHPTEIMATLSGARELFPNKKITVIFQPHLYSRTKLLLHEFAGAFSQAEKVIILPIYAAREKPDSTISSAILAEEIIKQGTNAKYVSTFDDATDYILENGKKGDLLITMGAGNVYKAGEMVGLVRKL